MRVSILCPLVIATIACFFVSQPVHAEVYGLNPGPVELNSIGPMTFGPSNVLFVGDTKAAKVYAINTEDSGKASADYAIEDVSGKIASALGVDRVSVGDMAVNPETGHVFVGVNAGGKGHLVRVAPDGTVTKLNMDKIGHAVAVMPNPPEDKVVGRGRRAKNQRNESITDIAYTDGRVLVSGLTTGDSPSAVREFDFPFRESSEGMQVQFYHAAHGQEENTPAIQTFVPFNVGGEASVLAGFTCTPLVKFPIAKIGDDAKVQGTTVAELGNRNKPFDMIVYEQEGKPYLLMANSSRGVMKISTEGLEQNEGLTKPVRGGGIAGQTFETIESLKDVVQLDKSDDTHAIVMVQPRGGSAMLKTITLP